MTKPMWSVLACFSIGCTVLGCAQNQMAQRTPILYPSAEMQRKSPAQVSADVDACALRAARFVQPRSTGEAMRHVTFSGLERAALGTAAGALGGTITGNTGRGMGAGAAIGGLTGAYGGIREISRVDPRERGFIQACLEDKGYRVIGWEGDR